MTGSYPEFTRKPCDGHNTANLSEYHAKYHLFGCFIIGTVVGRKWEESLFRLVGTSWRRMMEREDGLVMVFQLEKRGCDAGVCVENCGR